MSGRWIGVFAIACAGSLTFVAIGQSEDKAPDAKAKHSIKDVMKIAHKDGLLKKVLEEESTEADRLALLDAYVSLTESVPEMGSAEDWTKKTDAIVVAAAKVAVGRDDAKETLKAATNCAACHKEHKPSN